MYCPEKDVVQCFTKKIKRLLGEKILFLLKLEYIFKNPLKNGCQNMCIMLIFVETCVLC